MGRQGLREGLPTEDDKRGRNRDILATAVVALHWGGKGCAGPVGVPVSDKTVAPGLKEPSCKDGPWGWGRGALGHEAMRFVLRRIFFRVGIAVFRTIKINIFFQKERCFEGWVGFA